MSYKLFLKGNMGLFFWVYLVVRYFFNYSSEPR